MDEARAEAALRATRPGSVVGPLWTASRQWTTAVVLALFPALFILDAAVDLALSPVLPGLGFLLLLIVFLPFLLVEVLARRYRRKDPALQAIRAAKAVALSRAAMAVAAIWLLVWFAVGT